MWYTQKSPDRTYLFFLAPGASSGLRAWYGSSARREVTMPEINARDVRAISSSRFAWRLCLHVAHDNDISKINLEEEKENRE